MLAARIGLLVQVLPVQGWLLETLMFQELDRVQSTESGREEGRVVITKEEWERLQTRLTAGVVEAEVQCDRGEGGKVDLKEVREVCSISDTNLPGQITKERDHLASNCEKYKEDLSNEAKFRKEMEVRSSD